MLLSVSLIFSLLELSATQVFFNKTCESCASTGIDVTSYQVQWIILGKYIHFMILENFSLKVSGISKWVNRILSWILQNACLWKLMRQKVVQKLKLLSGRTTSCELQWFLIGIHFWKIPIISRTNRKREETASMNFTSSNSVVVTLPECKIPKSWCFKK